MPLSVEEDQPAERREALVECSLRSHVPLEIQMAKAVVVHEIEGAFADDLVGHLGISDRHVPRIRRVHRLTAWLVLEPLSFMTGPRADDNFVRLRCCIGWAGARLALLRLVGGAPTLCRQLPTPWQRRPGRRAKLHDSVELGTPSRSSRRPSSSSGLLGFPRPGRLRVAGPRVYSILAQMS